MAQKYQVDKITNHENMNQMMGGAGGGGGKKKKNRSIRTELTKEQKDDIKEAFELLDEKQQQVIKESDLKVALRALGFEPQAQEIKRLIQKINSQAKDPDQEDKNNEDGDTTFDYKSFEEIMTLKMSERDADTELKKAFVLFSQEKEFISFEDLK